MTEKLKSYDKLFHEIEQSHVILASGGVYRQAKLYRRFDGHEHQLFAKHGGGFIRLLAASGTSHHSVRWLHLDIDGAVLKKGDIGAPVLDPHECGLPA